MDANLPRIARARPRNGVLITTLFKKRFGFSDAVLGDIGLLFLAWSLFENEVEMAIWKLTAMPKVGERPATDGMQSSARLKMLTDAIAARATPEQLKALKLFGETAEHVLAYRNAIAHGRPLGGYGGQMSANNYPRRGEVRKRPPEQAHLYPGIVKLALEALETLNFAVYKLARTANVDEGIALMLSDPHLASARSAANEARNIASMINHEKY